MNAATEKGTVMAKEHGREKNEKKNRPSRGEGWIVILCDDDTNQIDDVIMAVYRSVEKMTMQQATEAVYAAHKSGQSNLIITTQAAAMKIHESLCNDGIKSVVEER